MSIDKAADAARGVQIAQATLADAAAPSTYIVLLDVWSSHPSGKVLLADADTIARLDADRVTYRAAAPTEIALGGFTV